MVQRSGNRTKLAVGFAVFATALGVAVFRMTTLSQLIGVRLRMPWLMNDFKSAIYCPVSIFLHGGNPYSREQFLRFCPVQDVFPLYLPATLILHAPFGLLPIDAATLAYFALNVALSLVIVLLALRLSDGEVTAAPVLLGAGLLLLSRPGQWNLLLGQPALELAIATYVALYLARRAPLVSGLALAVSMFKPTFGVPLALLMLVRGDTRAVLAGVGFAAVLNGPPLLVLVQRSGSWTAFTEELVRSQHAWQGVVDPATQVYGVDAPGLVSRLLGTHLPAVAYLGIALAVLGAAAAALRALPRVADRQVSHLSAAIICLGILLSVHHHAYDLVLLVAPAVALSRSSLPATFLRPWRRRTLLTLFVILGSNYITTLSILRHLERHHAAWLLLASLNGAVLLGIFVVYVAYPQPIMVRGGTVISPSA
jgi:glycosyl transferase family 87